MYLDGLAVLITAENRFLSQGNYELDLWRTERQ